MTTEGRTETRVVHSRKVRVTLRDWPIRDRSDYYATAHFDPETWEPIGNAFYSRGSSFDVPKSFETKLLDTMREKAREAFEATDPTVIRASEDGLRDRAADSWREMAATARAIAEACDRLEQRQRERDILLSPHASGYVHMLNDAEGHIAEYDTVYSVVQR